MNCSTTNWLGQPVGGGGGVERCVIEVEKPCTGSLSTNRGGGGGRNSEQGVTVRQGSTACVPHDSPMLVRNQNVKKRELFCNRHILP